ncbi:MAG: T9SS type A sorting domain-containing protein [Crocinitomicaceae bacterium]|nr:T9SS type A sorting domain-containing protein [Crocinitomicaceae bacterium]
MKTLLIAFFALTANLLVAQQWFDISVPTNKQLNDINFPTSTTGYIVGDSATILKTTDGGNTWVQTPLTGLPAVPWGLSITDVEFVDEQIGFIVFQNNGNGPFKTIDGGNTWTSMSNPGSNMCYKNSLYVNSETDIFLGGAGCFQSGQIEHYVDPIWTPTIVNYESFDPGEQVVEIDFNNGIGIAAMRGHYFLRTTDSGATWDSIPSGLTGNTYLTSVMFVTADSIYAGYDDGNGGGFALLMSTDAGLTWTGNSNTGSFFYPAFLSLGQANNGDIYAGGSMSWGGQGVLFETSDGINWYMGSVEHPINGIDSYGLDVTFAVGDSGYVIVNTPLANLGTGDDEYFYPITIYPNPTSDFITIENEFHKKVVYNLVNMNGQVVIENIASIDGTIIDVSILESGIYYLKSTEKQFNTVHKIVKL